MYTYIFTPFRKTLNEIKAEDLLVLRDVSEGWYVDYKKEGITTKIENGVKAKLYTLRTRSFEQRSPQFTSEIQLNSKLES